MLDVDTKRRIDSARDILVGKLPDPKSQVEQITIALIYKFMDDMDKESQELGGKAKFFTGGYQRYTWSKIFDPRISGFELVNIYGEAIQRMNQNPNIPQLFRDIFKNAYLPYRDPETLKSFLKIINDFKYDHSERLGDAFEYLLSVLGSQGEAGQFRTPRHIIDFMVEMGEPEKTDRILDPACGTAGFLISAYKFILKRNSSESKKVEKLNHKKSAMLSEVTLVNPTRYRGDKLSPDERASIISNVSGYDISPDMVRLSLVNMYLHGFSDPKIFEFDTLTNQDKWQDCFDCIFANPPFMTPKGGIRPHKLFSLSSRRAELLFVDYIINHLAVTGKGAVIVPEGIMFVEQAVFKKVRTSLVENSLIAVISLPHGVFKPYASVKTHIILMDKRLAKKAKNILFCDIESDGYTQTDTRQAIEEDDLPGVLRCVKEYKKHLHRGSVDLSNKLLQKAYMVSKEEILKQKWVHLIGRWYNLKNKYPCSKNQRYPFKKLGDICEVEKGQSPNMKTLPGEYPFVVPAEERKTADHYSFDASAVCVPLISSAGHGKADIKRIHYQEGKFALADTMCYLIPKNKTEIIPKYLYELLSYKKDEILVPFMAGATNVTMKVADIKKIRIPVPPLKVQEEVIKKATLKFIKEKIITLIDAFTKELKDDFSAKEVKKLKMLLEDISSQEKKFKCISSIWPNR